MTVWWKSTADNKPLALPDLVDAIAAVDADFTKARAQSAAESERRMAMVPEGLWKSSRLTDVERELVSVWVKSPDAVMHPKQASDLAAMLEYVFAKVTDD